MRVHLVKARKNNGNSKMCEITRTRADEQG